IRLDPRFAQAHTGLGLALSSKGDVEGAIRSFKEAIRIDPRYALAHAGLGFALTSYGDFANARQSFLKASDLFPREHPLSRIIAHQLTQCQQLCKLEQTLDDVLAGKHVPKDAGERIALVAIVKVPARQLYATAARLSNEAFQARPGL